MKSREYLVPLTVQDVCRAKAVGMDRDVAFWSPQTSGARVIEKPKQLPTGLMTFGDSIRKESKAKTVSIPIKNFDVSGPYHSTASQATFYYLDAQTTYPHISPDGFQVCSRPLNVISLDCLDSVHCWVEVKWVAEIWKEPKLSKTSKTQSKTKSRRSSSRKRYWGERWEEPP